MLKLTQPFFVACGSFLTICTSLHCSPPTQKSADPESTRTLKGLGGVPISTVAR